MQVEDSVIFATKTASWVKCEPLVARTKNHGERNDRRNQGNVCKYLYRYLSILVADHRAQALEP